MSTPNPTQYYLLPEHFGAKGDGVTDDTEALKNCIASALGGRGIVSLKPHGTYVISQTLVIPDYISVMGNNALIKVSHVWNQVTVGASVPVNTIIWVKGREPFAESEFAMSTRFIKDLKIDGNPHYRDMIGMYMGTADQRKITQPTSINYAVHKCAFKNISVSHVSIGLFLAEVWGSYFENISTSFIRDCGLKIQGQIVNNTFVGCQFSGANDGVYVDGAIYQGSIRRPEGCMFLGGFIGVAKRGVNVVRGLAFKFSHVIIDLNAHFAVTGVDMSDVVFDGCWIYCTARAIDIQAMFTIYNNTYVAFNNCQISSDGVTDPYVAYVHVRQNGIVFNGCKINGVMFWDEGSSGVVTNCQWSDQTTSKPRIIKYGTGYVRQSLNMFKHDGRLVATLGTW
ncbi:glycosyl hydrolase family 28-related protein [Neobacillus niacini]|uniref:glycosyl hydrolase family 28-related protein n=1 Tax=Neobacillus niacini TaxID=86668 RepID=UPI0007ABCBF4|nr:glycosyl hydrolase family 28-related protein [Neobacillus niacini]MEC1520726.1 glycosyl hydrolase family 28-related protein [Neobacillus niacini]